MSGKESKLQSDCLQELRRRKIYALNLYGDGMTGKGKPDTVTCINGEFVAFEFKVGDNGLQDAQIVHKNRILRNGGKHFVPRTFEEFTTILNELQGGIENETK